jgi:uncharacterized protein YdaU (DUF1376 family)
MSDENKHQAKAPAFQMYAADFYMDTQEMNPCETGAYTRLLMTQWVNGDLPLEVERLAGIAGMQLDEFKTAWETIKFKFYHSKKRCYNVRLDKTKKALIANRGNKSKAGKLGAEVRWAEEMSTKDKLAAIEALIKETTGDPTMQATGKYILDNINKIYKDVDYKWKDGDLVKFTEAWESWKIYKKLTHSESYKDPISESKAIGIIYKYSNGNVNHAVDMIELSIARQWKGVNSNYQLDNMHKVINTKDTSDYAGQK